MATAESMLRAGYSHRQIERALSVLLGGQERRVRACAN